MNPKDKDWRRKNIVAMGRAPCAKRSCRIQLKLNRTTDATIHERQSLSLSGARRSGRRQPSMPKFNLPERME